jgi:hypothetical protein
MGTIGLPHWDNMISAAMEDPDIALIGYEDVPGHPLNGSGGIPAWGGSSSGSSSLSSSQEVGDGGDRPMCKFYQRGNCMYGASCWYSHGTATAAKPQQKQQQSRQASSSSSSSSGAALCKFFTSAQGCRNGANCRFSHGDGNNSNSSNNKLSRSGADLTPGTAEDDDDEIDFTSVGGKDYVHPCSQCGKIPSVSGAGLCSMCCFGREDWDQ